MQSYILNLLTKDKNYPEIKLKKLKLGLNILMINIPKYLIIFSLSIYFNIFIYTLLVCLIFGILRTSSFGVHSKTSKGCLLTTIFFFIGGVYLCKFINLSTEIYVFISCTLIFLYYNYAPADTSDHPLENEKHRLNLRNRTLLNLFIFLAFGFLTTNYLLTNIIVLSCTLQLVSILPITYNFLGRRYNNYDLHQLL